MKDKYIQCHKNHLIKLQKKTTLVEVDFIGDVFHIQILNNFFSFNTLFR